MVSVSRQQSNLLAPPSDKRSAGSDSVVRAIERHGLDAETPARSLLVDAVSLDGGCELVRVSQLIPQARSLRLSFSPQGFDWGTRWNRDAGSERRSDAATEAFVALEWRRRLSEKGTTPESGGEDRSLTAEAA